jgi:hypothetical protein
LNNRLQRRRDSIHHCVPLWITDGHGLETGRLSTKIWLYRSCPILPDFKYQVCRGELRRGLIIVLYSRRLLSTKLMNLAAMACSSPALS